MPTKTTAPSPLSRSDIRAIYLQGEDAVVALIESFQIRLIDLEEKVALNSSNSSKPPSSDGLGRKPLERMTVSLRKKSGRKVGGQPGNPGKTLDQVAKPDATVTHRPECCPDCQAALPESLPSEGYCRRQVFEMPIPKVVVTEHRAVCVTCPGCGKQCRASFPQSVTQPVQYGPNLLAFATYLHGVHLLPFGRAAEVMQALTGAPFSPSSLSQALKAAHKVLEPFEAAVKEALSQVPIKHVDETGTRVAGKLHWFHDRCTATLSYLFRHEKRGGEAALDLADYQGILVSDFWSSYVPLNCRHAFCGAHLLRELTFQKDVKHQRWAAELILLLEDAVSACNAARARGAAKVWDAHRFAREYDEWVNEGLRCSPPPERGKASKACCLLERMQRHKESCLRFLRDLSVPFTNNAAEQDVRMFKIKGKISGGFRTEDGADRFCRLRSYTTTCRKQNMPILLCLQSLFQRRLIMPQLVPE
jgi:transposase